MIISLGPCLLQLCSAPPCMGREEIVLPMLVVSSHICEESLPGFRERQHTWFEHFDNPAFHPNDLNGTLAAGLLAGSRRFERRQGLALPVVERVAEYRRAAWVLDYARRREVAPAEAPRLAEEASRDLLEYAGLVSGEKRAAFARDLAEDMDVMAVPAAAPAKERVLNMFKIVCGD